MAQDLRSYLDLVKRRKPGDFEIVSKPVDPRFEITALVVKLEREGKRRPVILFENVKGTPLPGPHQSARQPPAPGRRDERGARGDAGDLPARDGQAAHRRRSCRAARCTRWCSRGIRSTSTTCPRSSITRATPGRTSRRRSRSPRTRRSEIWNCAYNRLQIKSRNTTSIHLTTGKHLWEFQRIAEARDEPLPLALVIGVHPAIALGALAIGSDRRGRARRSWAGCSASRSSW